FPDCFSYVQVRMGKSGFRQKKGTVARVRSRGRKQFCIRWLRRVWQWLRAIGFSNAHSFESICICGLYCLKYKKT
ncbi:hypothetical protein, partial [Brevibacillus agri]|uniref:hypothetical protein n=1 Tax=Brevibacillus agri TaxID=51101 RepID=UPI003D1A4CF9